MARASRSIATSRSGGPAEAPNGSRLGHPTSPWEPMRPERSAAGASSDHRSCIACHQASFLGLKGGEIDGTSPPCQWRAQKRTTAPQTYRSHSADRVPKSKLSFLDRRYLQGWRSCPERRQDDDVGGVTQRIVEPSDSPEASCTKIRIPAARTRDFDQLLCLEFCAVRVDRPAEVADEKARIANPYTPDVTLLRTASGGHALKAELCVSAAHLSLQKSRSV
jgi:hypothetical protein